MPDISSYYDDALEAIAKTPQILQNYMQYLQPEIATQINEQFNEIDMSVQDPRLKTLARREMLGKLLPRMTQQALGQAIMGQESAEFQRDVTEANIHSQIADTQISVDMFEDMKKQAEKNAKLGFIGSMIGTGATLLGAPGVMPAIGKMVGGGSQQPSFNPMQYSSPIGPQQPQGYNSLMQFYNNPYFMSGSSSLPMY